MKKFALALVLAAVPLVAQAGTVSYTGTIGPQLTDINDGSGNPLSYSPDLYKFNTNLGTLTGVSLTSVLASGTTTITVSATTAATYYFTVDLAQVLSSSDAAVNAVVNPLFVDGMGNYLVQGEKKVANVTHQITLMALGTDTYSAMLGTTLNYTLTSGQFSAFEANTAGQSLGLLFQTSSTALVGNTGGNVQVSQSSTATATATVTYTYDAPTQPTSTPEPATLAAAAMGIAAFGFARLRRKSA